MKNKDQFWVVLGVLMTLMILLGYQSRKCDKFAKSLKNSQDSIVMLRDSISNILGFSPDNVMTFLEFYQVQYADTVFKQILLETGRFNSDVFISNNNLFGMKQPKKRPTTSIASSKGYAVYSSYLESIKDYKLYQSRYYKGGDYLDFLKGANYSQDPEYINKIKSIK